MFDALTLAAVSALETMGDCGDVALTWERPSDVAHGDVTTNIALRLAKRWGTSPRDIASALAKKLEASLLIERIEVAGAGYVNVWLKPEVLLSALGTVTTATEEQKERKKEAPVIIEGSDPNIAKPLGVHHILSTMIGQSLVNLYRHAGFHVIAWNYIGDWGTQFGSLSVAVARWGSGKSISGCTVDELLALYVKFHEEAERDPSLVDEAREAFRRLEEGDAALCSFWEEVVTVTKAALAPVYERLGVAFDLDLGESFYNNKMDGVIDEGQKKGVFTEGERGALIVSFPEDTHMPVYMIRRADGATLYSTRDLAQMRYRIDTYHPRTILIPTDISQKLHFEQLIATCKMLGWDLPEFENVLFGRMRFADRAMSTRKGNVLKLEEVLDEAVRRADAIIKERGDAIQTDDPAELAEMMGIGALVYGILSQNRKMDIVFDWDKMLSFEGNSAPYLQYTYARSRSVLRKAEIESVTLPTEAASITPSERNLISSLLPFSSVLEEARQERLPHKLATFLYELAQAYNAFYNSEPILKAEEPMRTLRLSLTDLTGRVLRTGLHLLTLRVPERM